MHEEQALFIQIIKQEWKNFYFPVNVVDSVVLLNANIMYCIGVDNEAMVRQQRGDAAI